MNAERPEPLSLDRSDPDIKTPRKPFVKDGIAYVPARNIAIGSATHGSVRYGLLMVDNGLVGLSEAMTPFTMRTFGQALLDEADLVEAENKASADAQLAGALAKKAGRS